MKIDAYGSNLLVANNCPGVNSEDIIRLNKFSSGSHTESKKGDSIRGVGTRCVFKHCSTRAYPENVNGMMDDFIEKHMINTYSFMISRVSTDIDVSVGSKQDINKLVIKQGAYLLYTMDCEFSYFVREAPASLVKKFESVFLTMNTVFVCPYNNIEDELKALIIDSWFDPYLGVVSLIRIVNGEIKVGEKIKVYSTNQTYKVEDVGIFSPKKIKKEKLSAGEVGYLVSGIKDIKGAPVGDTLTSNLKEEIKPLPGFKTVTPNVFSSLFTIDSDDYERFRDALSKLALNDSSLVYEPEVSDALGFGFRCGFLGTLHMEVVRERLEREYDLDLISTAPSVQYEVLRTDGETIICDNPSQLPEPNYIEEIREPIVRTNILTPNEYVGSVITLCNNNRGVQKNMEYFGNQVSIVFELPLGGVIIDFFDQIKSITKGFASVEHSLIGFVKSDLTKIDVLINNNKVDALSMIVHKSFSNRKAREIAKNLQKLIPRQMFDVPIQVTLGSKIISRETVKAYRKNVTAKLYGGDVTRKKKLLEKQKEGKKKMKQLGNVSIPQEAFLNYFNSGD